MYECSDHGMLFNDHEQYLQHKNRECEQMLLQRKICAHLLADDIRCKKSFFTTTGLVLHYEKCHRQFLCVECFELFDNEKLLEHHGNIPHYPQHSTCEYLNSFVLSNMKWMLTRYLLGVHLIHDKSPLFHSISTASENVNTANSSIDELASFAILSSLSDHIFNSSF